MRLGFVLNNLSGGGAERVAVNVANMLSTMGHDVSLLLNYKKGPYLSDVSENVRIITLGKRMLRAMPSLVRVLRREKFDAIFTVLDQPTIACLLVKPFIGDTKVIVIECNNPLAGDISSKIWRFIRGLRPKLYPRASHIITKSNGIRHALISHFNARPEQVTVIVNPVDLVRINGLAQAEPSIDLPGAPLVVGMGRLSAQKDFATLIDAFALLRSRRPAHLLILGEGALRPQLAAQVERLGLAASVSMPGFSQNPYAVIAKADAFVLSSRWEGWPNALVEALACGTASVATDCESGPREILGEGRFGPLVPVGNNGALADAIEEVLDRPADPEFLKGQVAEFTPAKIAACYIEVLEKVVTR